jgi:hypothetical protein
MKYMFHHVVVVLEKIPRWSCIVANHEIQTLYKKKLSIIGHTSQNSEKGKLIIVHALY